MSDDANDHNDDIRGPKRKRLAQACDVCRRKKVGESCVIGRRVLLNKLMSAIEPDQVRWSETNVWQL